jgi:hypothetical protein
VSASHHAPFGKGEETVVDEQVRKTWELGSDAFEIRNQEWEGVVRNAMGKIAKQIRVRDGEVEAQLYKMLFYEEGGDFKAHQE